MNKLFCSLTLIAIALSSCAYADDMYPAEFAAKLSTCSAYRGEFLSEKREIIGWKNGKCLYQEAWDISPMNMKTQCYFSNSQIKELSAAMKNNRPSSTGLSVVYPNGMEVFYNTGTVATNLWSKYLNMPGVCSNNRILK